MSRSRLLPRNALRIAPLAALSLFGCASGPDDSADANSECDSGKCDALDDPEHVDQPSPCDGVLVDHSGRGLTNFASRLEDPFAQKVLMPGDSCPATYAGIIEKLRETDAEGCVPEDPHGSGRDGLMSRIVSETGQILAEIPGFSDTDFARSASYRVVTSRQCGDRPIHGLVFSLFGVRPGDTTPPRNVEIMAFDEVAGVFNYYETTSSGQINFFGNSNDFVEQGPGADGETRRCAACHTGGGMVMKELDTPWLHWEGHMDIKGASDLVCSSASQFDPNTPCPDSTIPSLGFKTDGAEFEFVVKDANTAWNDARIDHLLETGQTSELLRPLFCGTEVNLDNGADFCSKPDGSGACSDGSQDDLRSIPNDALIDPLIDPSSVFGIQITDGDYPRLIAASGQSVAGVPGATDTVFDYPFIEPSHGDRDFICKLQQRGIVDQDFVRDVLMVDFTRPVFSDERCGLLEHVPQLPAGQIDADTLRSGMLRNLAGATAGTPEDQLRRHLENTADRDRHEATVEGFLRACQAQADNRDALQLGGAPVGPFLFNHMRWTSVARRKAESLPVFEFPQTMPRIDDPQGSWDVPDGFRLHPMTCQSATGFVPVE